MAQAPRPGVSKRAEATKAARRLMRISIRDESKLVAPNNLPFHIGVRIRKACGGLPITAFWNGETAVDEDSLKVLWWAARMMNGEPTVSLATVLEEWPDDLTEDDLEVRIVGEDGEDALDVDEAAAEQVGESPEA